MLFPAVGPTEDDLDDAELTNSPVRLRNADLPLTRRAAGYAAGYFFDKEGPIPSDAYLFARTAKNTWLFHPKDNRADYRQRAGLALHKAATLAGEATGVTGEAPALTIYASHYAPVLGGPSNAPAGHEDAAPADSAPVGQARVDDNHDQPAHVEQARVDDNIMLNSSSGKAIQIAELGHGSVWVQYRQHQHRSDGALSQSELAAKQYGLPLDKLGVDFGTLLEQELEQSDLPLRVQTVNNAAKVLFSTYVDDYEFTQRAGPP